MVCFSIATMRKQIVEGLCPMGRILTNHSFFLPRLGEINLEHWLLMLPVGKTTWYVWDQAKTTKPVAPPAPAPFGEPWVGRWLAETRARLGYIHVTSKRLFGEVSEFQNCLSFQPCWTFTSTCVSSGENRELSSDPVIGASKPSYGAMRICFDQGFSLKMIRPWHFQSIPPYFSKKESQVHSARRYLELKSHCKIGGRLTQVSSNCHLWWWAFDKPQGVNQLECADR